MRNTLAIARKELGIYFTTPWAYVVLTVMVFISAFFFLLMLGQFTQIQMDARMAGGWNRLPPEYQEWKNLTDGVVANLWGTVAVITLFMIPLLSMRLFAEEKRNRTFELLMTAPVRPFEIVLGKYLGGLGAVTATLGVTIVFPIILSIYGSSESGTALEWRTVLLGYGGLLLWGAAALAIGMFVSSLTDSQLVAGVITFALALIWWLLNGAGQFVDEPLRSVLNYVSFGRQLSSTFRGLLELKTLVFFGSVIALFFLLTHRAVEAQRWS